MRFTFISYSNLFWFSFNCIKLLSWLGGFGQADCVTLRKRFEDTTSLPFSEKRLESVQNNGFHSDLSELPDILGHGHIEPTGQPSRSEPLSKSSVETPLEHVVHSLEDLTPSRSSSKTRSVTASQKQCPHKRRCSSERPGYPLGEAYIGRRNVFSVPAPLGPLIAPRPSPYKIDHVPVNQPLGRSMSYQPSPPVIALNARWSPYPLMTTSTKLQAHNTYDPSLAASSSRRPANSKSHAKVWANPYHDSSMSSPQDYIESHPVVDIGIFSRESSNTMSTKSSTLSYLQSPTTDHILLRQSNSQSFSSQPFSSSFEHDVGQSKTLPTSRVPQNMIVGFPFDNENVPEILGDNSISPKPQSQTSPAPASWPLSTPSTLNRPSGSVLSIPSTPTPDDHSASTSQSLQELTPELLRLENFLMSDSTPDALPSSAGSGHFIPNFQFDLSPSPPPPTSSIPLPHSRPPLPHSPNQIQPRNAFRAFRFAAEISRGHSLIIETKNLQGIYESINLRKMLVPFIYDRLVDGMNAKDLFLLLACFWGKHVAKLSPIDEQKSSMLWLDDNLRKGSPFSSKHNVPSVIRETFVDTEVGLIKAWVSYLYSQWEEFTRPSHLYQSQKYPTIHSFIRRLTSLADVAYRHAAWGLPSLLDTLLASNGIGKRHAQALLRQAYEIVPQAAIHWSPEMIAIFRQPDLAFERSKSNLWITSAPTDTKPPIVHSEPNLPLPNSNSLDR
ncbi:hypothetical protein CROQUDRAFT_675182 [Cronartium quercuum f. sp. fusiforme G11]|uniref:Meiotically up-regulated protein Msb1/Mug8 domain-containing protein n=1 Tax=Cronartium quercuum f. sp. fusiforme G11 TaxID=708437 RepID=A0A9P6N7S1_9BASI|nr:hypothetical protein CROQUDRAFT_675182 [Cronartium quercuum f. sp. fusiforme G11]